jgi:hypothetical protein
VDHSSIERSNGGRQIDWANVNSSYINSVTGKKELKAGTIIGELLGGGKVSPRVVTTNPATGVLESDAVEDSLIHAETGYGIIRGGVLYENLMPDATGGPPAVINSTVKTELQTNCPKGFHFEVYQDNR